MMVRFDVLYGNGMMILLDILYGKTRYVIWHAGMLYGVGGKNFSHDMMVRFDILYGQSTVCDMVCWWYGVMVRSGGCIISVNIA